MGPKLANGRYLLLAGTDNDYSVTQNAALGGAQRDVWFDFSQADPYARSIQCPLNLTTGCIATTGGAAVAWSSSYQLLPGVLHAYTVSAAELGNYIAPVPEPTTWALMLAGLAGLVAFKRCARPAA